MMEMKMCYKFVLRILAWYCTNITTVFNYCLALQYVCLYLGGALFKSRLWRRTYWLKFFQVFFSVFKKSSEYDLELGQNRLYFVSHFLIISLSHLRHTCVAWYASVLRWWAWYCVRRLSQTDFENWTFVVRLQSSHVTLYNNQHARESEYYVNCRNVLRRATVIYPICVKLSFQNIIKRRCEFEIQNYYLFSSGYVLWLVPVRNSSSNSGSFGNFIEIRYRSVLHRTRHTW